MVLYSVAMAKRLINGKVGGNGGLLCVWGMFMFWERFGLEKVRTLSAKSSLIFSAFDLVKHPMHALNYCLINVYSSLFTLVPALRSLNSQTRKVSAKSKFCEHTDHDTDHAEPTFPSSGHTDRPIYS